MSLQVETPAAVGMPKKKFTVRGWLREYTFAFALVLAIVLFLVNLILQPNFNVTSQFGTFAPLAIAAIASTPAIISGRGGIDMSISPLMTFVAIIYTTVLFPAGLGGAIALPILLAVGAAVGAINGLIIVGLRLQPVVVTISMFFILSGLNAKIAPQPTSVTGTWFTAFAGSIGPVPGGLLLILVPIIIWVLVRRTAYGRNLFTVGGNDTTAFSAGMNVGATRVIAFALGGMFAAFGSVALVGLTSSAAAGTSGSYTLIGIAAVALGGTALRGGRGGIIGSVLGAAVILFIQNLLATLKVSQTWVAIVYGLLLLFAVIVGAQLSAHKKPSLDAGTPSLGAGTKEKK